MNTTVRLGRAGFNDTRMVSTYEITESKARLVLPLEIEVKVWNPGV
jgi:hypothetical protein